MTTSPSEAAPENFTVCQTDRFRALTQADLRAQGLADALRRILNMKSCLLADAQEIAKEALNDA